MIQDRKECFICGRWTGLECHHIFGGPWRKISDQDGLTCWLCYEHHRGPQGVHMNRDLDLKIKRVGQFIFEQNHTRAEFMQRYGQNYDTMEQDEQEGRTKMSDYYPKSTSLPRDVYNRVLWLVRGYDRIQEELELLALPEGLQNDGEPRGTGTSDPTVVAAIRREKLWDDIHAIDTALETVPAEYREVVFLSIKDMRPMRSYPGYDYAAERTWKRWRGRFMAEVARNKGWWV